MSVLVQTIKRSSLRDQIVRQLVELVVSGQLKPGEALPPERQLAEQLGVSRTAIREAVSIIAAQGFLDVRHGSGTFANPPELWNNLDPVVLLVKGKSAALHELMEVREYVEPTLAQLAAQRATEDDLQALEAALALGDSTEEAAEADLNFHLLIARASGNRVFEIMLHSVADLMREVRRELFMLPATTDQALARHAEVLDRIRAKDAEGAFRVMQQHIREANEHSAAILRSLSGSGQ